MYCTTSPGYPLTSSTVYSPPPRPLPRNTFSRPAFSLKKPYKHCNWKCAALSAILISVTLLLLLAYFIGESLWKLLTHQDVYLYRMALSPIPNANARCWVASLLPSVLIVQNLGFMSTVILGLKDWLLSHTTRQKKKKKKKNPVIIHRFGWLNLQMGHPESRSCE